MLVIKKPCPVQAFALGEQTAAELEFIRSGQLSPTEEGLWRLKTREAPVEGELVRCGDYIKLDSIGMPYPVEKNWFEANHEKLREGWYIQKTSPRKAWRSTMPIAPEIQFLLDNGLLHWQEHTFSAFLWGTMQTANEDAVIVLDAVDCTPDGTVTKVEFHFIAADEFEKVYDILP